MKLTFFISLAFASVFQPANVLFASAHPPAHPPAPSPASFQVNEKALCVTPPGDGTDCGPNIPMTEAAEDPIRSKCVKYCNPNPGWVKHVNHWQCVILPKATNGTIYCVS